MILNGLLLCLFDDEFLCLASKSNEIHSRRQRFDIDLLNFLGDGALQQGLAHHIGDAVGWVW